MDVTASELFAVHRSLSLDISQFLPDISLSPADVGFTPKADIVVECAPGAGQVEARELTGCAGLSKDESHGQTAFPQH